MFDNNNDDYRAEIEMWADMWDQAQEEDIHPAPEAPQPSEFAASVLGDDQDPYWDYVDGEEQLLQEQNTPNPVYPDSVGKDSKTDPVWVKDDFLKEVETLKDRLFKVENQMAKMGVTDNSNQKPLQGVDSKLMSEIESLRKKIDQVSDNLGIKNEKSPWVVKND